MDKGWKTVYLGLGSNLNCPKKQLKKAIELLKSLANCRWRATSSFVKSHPQGPQDQPDFVNAVLCLETSLSAMDLLRACQGIEHLMGKQKKRDWGERVIDIDLLLYGDDVIHEADLTVPHPYMLERDFVLFPLLEITPSLKLPGGQSLAHYAAMLSNAFIVQDH